MGKQMMNNPDVNPTWGLVAIWSGIVALLVANGAIYSCLVRR